MIPYNNVNHNPTHQAARSQSDTGLPQAVEHSSEELNPDSSSKKLSRKRFYYKKQGFPPVLGDSKQDIRKKHQKDYATFDHFFILKDDLEIPVISRLEYTWLHASIFAESEEPVPLECLHTVYAKAEDGHRKNFVHYVLVDGEEKKIVHGQKIIMKEYFHKRNQKSTHTPSKTNSVQLQDLPDFHPVSTTHTPLKKIPFGDKFPPLEAKTRLSTRLNVLCPVPLRPNTDNHPAQHIQAPRENPDDSITIKINRLYHRERKIKDIRENPSKKIKL